MMKNNYRYNTVRTTIAYLLFSALLLLATQVVGQTSNGPEDYSSLLPKSSFLDDADLEQIAGKSTRNTPLNMLDGGGGSVGGRMSPRGIGPSGKPRIHSKNYNSKKQAREAAQQNSANKNKPVHHATQKNGDRPHYHASDKKGNKKQDGVHYYYRGKGKSGGGGW